MVPSAYRDIENTHSKAGNAASDDKDALVGMSGLAGVDALMKDEPGREQLVWVIWKVLRGDGVDVSRTSDLK